jgi:hypothetical protein
MGLGLYLGILGEANGKTNKEDLGEKEREEIIDNEDIRERV